MHQHDQGSCESLVCWVALADTCRHLHERTASKHSGSEGVGERDCSAASVSCAVQLFAQHQHQQHQQRLHCMGNCNLLPCSLTRTLRTPVDRLASQLLKEDVVTQADILQGHHCIHPKCLEASLKRSLTRLGLETLDVLYLHDAAEVQLEVLGRQKFLVRGRCKAGQKSLVRGGPVRRGRVYW